MSKAAFAPLRNLILLEELALTLKNRDHRLPGLGLFHGRSGDGKSFAAAWVAASDLMAYYVTATDYWTPRAMLDDIVKAMGLRPAARATNDDKAKLIAAELEASRRPLIIDEGDFVAAKGMLDKVRGLHDLAAPGTASIIFITEEGGPQRFQRYERVHSRILRFQPAQPCGLDDARELARLYAPRITVADDLLERLVKETFGSTRRVSLNLTDVARYAAGEGMKVITAADYRGQTVNTGAAPAVRRFG